VPPRLTDAGFPSIATALRHAVSVNENEMAPAREMCQFGQSGCFKKAFADRGSDSSSGVVR